MAPSESEIRTLLSTQSYSPSSVTPLEDFLTAQAAGEVPYLFDAVRTLIKLYQLFPETKNEQHIAAACTLALVESYPQTDLLALSYMTTVPPEIAECAQQLNDCHFAAFWKSFSELPKQDAARRRRRRLQQAIASVLALTYQRAPLAMVQAALDDNSTNVEDLEAIERVDGDIVVFVATRDNSKRERVYQEGVSFDTVTSLLAKIAQ